ncbi:MAG: hypothetical protein Q9181_004695 [Wetmoreana brouardii]
MGSGLSSSDNGTTQSYSEILATDETILINCISALGDLKTDHGTQEEEKAFSVSKKATQKEIRTLDGLSQLLVFRPSEACAMTLIQEVDTVTVYWAKNSPDELTGSQQAYVDALLKVFPQQTHPGDILALCVEQCLPKIMSRVKKTTQEFNIISDVTNLLGLSGGHPSYLYFEQRLRDRGVLAKHFTLVDSVDAFLKALARVGTGFDMKTLLTILTFADAITLGERDGSSIFNSFQLRGVKKLGAYRKVISQVLTICKQTGITKLTEQQIPTPNPREILVLTRTEDALDMLNPYMPNIDPIPDFSQLSQHFHRQQGKRIALLFLNLHIKARKRGAVIKIGCLKVSCHWCHLYLTELNQRYPDNKAITSAFDDKRVKGWLMPEGDDVVRDIFLNRVGKTVEELFRNRGLPVYNFLDLWPFSWNEDCEAEEGGFPGGPIDTGKPQG